jgi:hypothetical protein
MSNFRLLEIPKADNLVHAFHSNLYNVDKYAPFLYEIIFSMIAQTIYRFGTF